ncbi:MAG: MFS transporter [Thermoplasmata archaeon]|nr:MFS transporter [Thermoplasmata archaeon]
MVRSSIGRGVIILGVVSLLTDVSSEMIIPLIPFFLASEMGASGLAIGLITSAMEGVGSLVRIVSGALSDRFRRRKAFMVSGYGLSTTAKAFLPFTTHWGQVLGIQAVERTGKGIRSAPRDALIADLGGKRGASYGLHKAMDTTGAVIGVVLALVLFPVLGFRTTFMLAVVPAAAAVLVLMLVRERRGPVRRAAFAIPRGLRPFLLVTALFTIGSVPIAFMLLMAGKSVVDAVALYLLFNIVFAASSFPMGSLADRRDPGRLLVAGYLIMGAVLAAFALSASMYVHAMLFAVLGVQYAIVEPVEKVFVASVAGESNRGTAFGAYHMTKGLALLPAGILAGLLWDVDPTLTFLVGAAIAATAAVAMALVLGTHGRRERPNDGASTVG